MCAGLNVAERCVIVGVVGVHLGMDGSRLLKFFGEDEWHFDFEGLSCKVGRLSS